MGRSLTFCAGGIVYTEVLGWVDMGHARGSDIMELKN